MTTPTPKVKVQVLTLDELLAMIAADDGMPEGRPATEGNWLEGKCNDPDCPFCHPQAFPHTGRSSEEN